MSASICRSQRYGPVWCNSYAPTIEDSCYGVDGSAAVAGENQGAVFLHSHKVGLHKAPCLAHSLVKMIERTTTPVWPVGDWLHASHGVFAWAELAACTLLSRPLSTYQATRLGRVRTVNIALGVVRIAAKIDTPTRVHLAYLHSKARPADARPTCKGRLLLNYWLGNATMPCASHRAAVVRRLVIYLAVGFGGNITTRVCCCATDAVAACLQKGMWGSRKHLLDWRSARP